MSARAGRRPRRLIVALVSIAIVIAAVVALCVPIYAPRDDSYNVREIDAVFILGPPTDDRIALGEQIAQRAGEVPIYLSVWHGVVCKPQFVCVHADPWTTVGEAAALAEAVREDGVRHPLVVTSSVHAMRARYIFSRCVPVHTPVVAVHPGLQLWDVIWQPIYQWGAMVKFMVGGCVESKPGVIVRSP